MNVENEYNSLEQGKKFKELGIECSRKHHFQGGVHSEAWGNDFYPAFNTAELGLMLPAYISHSGVEYTLHCGKSKDGLFECGYVEIGKALSSKHYVMKNAIHEAQVRAATLFYLIEKEKITTEEMIKTVNP